MLLAAYYDDHNFGGNMGYELFYYICLAFVAKSMLIGSEFNFGAWMKYGKKYSSWYFGRESWSDYLSRTKEN